MGVYSKSADAAKKKKIDDDIAKQKIPIDMHNEAYLKALIAASSKDKSKVSGNAKGLQFFIVRGGAEGFLGDFYDGKDASRMVTGDATTTSGGAGVSMVFDENDLLIAFDKHGKLIDTAQLQRPLSIKNAPVKWTEGTANKVYDAWDGQPVSVYKNNSFDVTYYGLAVDDKLGWYRSGKVRVDMHKQEATNGCIFIVDNNTPEYNDKATDMLSQFEPEFIKKIQQAVGAKVGSDIGTMHMLDVNSK
jgi:hypothetical protein